MPAALGPITRPPVYDHPPQAAYVHIPFCRHRCGYCNFTVVAGRDDLVDAYLKALQRELTALEYPRPVRTLYIGGGTPSHLRPRQLERMLRLVTQWFPLAPEGEFTVEANPEDVDPPRLQCLAAAGVNRLSLGVQSVSSHKLRQLERGHSAEQVRRACGLARPLFADLSLDLIFATPGETLSQWRHDLETVIQLPIDHLSTYGLTYERGTRFWSRRLRGELVELDDDRQRTMYGHTIDRLEQAGWEHYEVSSFARRHHRSRHNQGYWLGRSYYAAGAGAARYIQGCRSGNHRSTTTYIRRLQNGISPVHEREELSQVDRSRELLVLWLRMREGINGDQFLQRTGWTVEHLGGAAMEDFLSAGWLERVGRHIRLTRDGLMISDALWPQLL